MGIDFGPDFTRLTDAGGGGDAPFPWQARLFDRFTRSKPPRAIDIPTGLGKTRAMLVWLLAWAAGAPLARRLVYVVDRRAIVDQASAEAASIASAAARTLSEAPGRLGRLDRPPAISTLRGRHVDSGAWREDPSRPAIVVGTVDMIGSRLLFEGYGVSRRMRPLHAGLLGVDSLIMLDEAHLIPPFEALIESVAADPTLRGQRRPPVPPLTLMSLSATQDNAGKSEALRLDETDRSHLEVKRRISASKRLFRSLRTGLATTKQTIKPKALAEALADATWPLLAENDRPSRCVVYCDHRDVAERAHEMLAQRCLQASAIAEPILFTGARRVRERASAEAALCEAGFVAGSAKDRSVALVATSAAEVGVDLDCDHAVMDLVAWERMVQRLGRVNRRGLGDATVTVVDAGLAETPSGADLAATRDLLDRLPQLTDGAARDASPAALSTLSAAHVDLAEKASTPRPLRPALTLPLAEAWSLTNLVEHTGRPDIRPWLRGWVDEQPWTNLIWRRHLPVRSGAAAPKAEAEAFFRHARPHLGETLETESARAAAWLIGRGEAIRKGEEAQAALDDDAPVAFVLASDGALTEVLKLADIAAAKKSGLDARLAFRLVVLDARLGGLGEAGLLSDSAGASPPVADGDAAWPEVGFKIVARTASEPEQPAAFSFVTARAPEGDADAWLDICLEDRVDSSEDAAARGSKLTTLTAHSADVEQAARRLAERLGLEAPLGEALALAARLHDTGKAAPIWQRAMNAPEAGGPYAKTPSGDGRRLAGYRHEFGSLLQASADRQVQALSADLRDLVLHLIAAHHGGARPVIAVTGVDALPPSALESAAADAALRFARLQKTWGVWGLAWWEALLRAADQIASRGSVDG